MFTTYFKGKIELKVCRETSFAAQCTKDLQKQELE